MKIVLLLSFLVSTHVLAANPSVVMETNMGTIEIELFQDKAPLSVANFLKYVDDKFYDGTIFHRVINGFMIQGGGFDEKMVQKPTRAAIKNEATNKIPNTPGTVAMARLPSPHSATAQFFINVENNSNLDHRDTTDNGYGYAVFGKVTTGMHVVNRIKALKTGVKNGFSDVPMDTVVIKTVSRKK